MATALGTAGLRGQVGYEQGGLQKKVKGQRGRNTGRAVSDAMSKTDIRDHVTLIIFVNAGTQH